MELPQVLVIERYFYNLQCWNKNFASKKELLTRSLSADDKCEETAKVCEISFLSRRQYTFLVLKCVGSGGRGCEGKKGWRGHGTDQHIPYLKLPTAHVSFMT